MNVKIKDIPKNERPRERLMSCGVENISNEELLSIILKTGTKENSVKDVSLDLISKVGVISNLKDITYDLLVKIKGIGSVKAIELIAVIELGKRIYMNNMIDTKTKLGNAKDIYDSIKYLFYNKKQEYFYCLYFNNKQELIDKKLLFIGTINKSIIHPREIFKEAYLCSASRIVCIHNHPSNDVNPSYEDIEMTKALIKIGNINGIPVVDHIIVGDNSYYSFYENNIVKWDIK